MSHALPLPRRNTLVVPIAALALGLAGGTTAALVIEKGDTIVRPAPAVQIKALPEGATPVPERVSPAPPAAASQSQSGPAPERVSPSPTNLPKTSSLAGTTSGRSTAPVPERISGARTR